MIQDCLIVDDRNFVENDQDQSATTCDFCNKNQALGLRVDVTEIREKFPWAGAGGEEVVKGLCE